MIRAELSALLHEAADETNDQYAHDELHAAGGYVALHGFNRDDSTNQQRVYVTRWIDELCKRYGVKA